MHREAFAYSRVIGVVLLVEAVARLRCQLVHTRVSQAESVQASVKWKRSYILLCVV